MDNVNWTKVWEKRDTQQQGIYSRAELINKTMESAEKKIEKAKAELPLLKQLYPARNGYNLFTEENFMLVAIGQKNVADCLRQKKV